MERIRDMALLITNAKLFDRQTYADILIEDGKITEVKTQGDGSLVLTEGEESGLPAAESQHKRTVPLCSLDAEGLTVAPGLFDMHTHLREPGYEYKEDITTGAAAAAAGGVTTVCCMPNTSPVADNAETIRYIIEKAQYARVDVLPYGAITIGQAGRELTDFESLLRAGAVALSDDGNPIQNAAIARAAMQKAKELGLVLISHCEDAELVGNYALNEGKLSRKMGLPGRPAIAEELMAVRDVMLAAETGAKLHIAHVSTAGTVEIIRRAKEAGVAVTAETCPHYFSLTEDEIERLGTHARVNPPLRTAADVAAIIEGLKDGTIDAIATDHAPHAPHEKALPLMEAPSGMIGLETSLAAALTYLYHTGKFSLAEIMALMSATPARILGLEAGAIKPGAFADIVIFDPDEKWVVDSAEFRSKARNTPYAGKELRGKVKCTLYRGSIVYTGNED